MDPVKFLEKVPPEFKTQVWSPEVTRITSPEEDGDFDKFGGIPSVEKDFKLPSCKECKGPLQFFFQLTDPRTKEISEAYQLFVCMKNCGEHTCLARKVDYKTYSVKNFPSPEPYLKHAYSYKEEGKEYYENWLNSKYGQIPFQCFRVVKWNSSTELIGKDLLVENYADLLEGSCDDPDEKAHRFVYLLHEKSAPSTPFAGLNAVKFGGDGESCQGISYHDCDLHFADTEYLPYMWGDAGYAHLGIELRVRSDCC